MLLVLHLTLLLGSFAAILFGSELFTNGAEWVGERLALAEAAVGSLVAAVGTALPETIIPLIALISAQGPTDPRANIGTGSIVGAPLLLATVAQVVMAAAVYVHRKRRPSTSLVVASRDVRRDLGYFMVLFSAALAVAIFRPVGFPEKALAIPLLIGYGLYCFQILRLRRAPEADVSAGLHLERILRKDARRPRTLSIAVQTLLGILVMLGAAHLFVEQIMWVANRIGIEAGTLALLVAPLATELPEKYNSVVWIRENKDNLALGNITGAMVFQAAIPVSLGLVFTPWHLSAAERLAAVVALASSLILYLAAGKGKVAPSTMLAGGLGYMVFLLGLGFIGDS